MNLDCLQAITVHGASISYFTGKLENYLRVEGVPYTMRSVNFPREGLRLLKETGVSQIPAVELGDGRWMTEWLWRPAMHCRWHYPAGVSYKKARYSRYRVWCLQELRDQFKALPADAQATVQQLLEKHGGWEPLWRQAELPLLPGQEQQLPFKGSYKMVGINEQKLRT